MSDFNIALQKLLLLEGGYINNDSGGPTKFGISMHFLQHIGRHPTESTIQNLTDDEASRLYNEYFWTKYNYSAISNQDIANAVFIFAVNAGPATSNKCLQRCLRAVNGTILADDGMLGFKSMVAVNSAPAINVLIAFKCFADAYYRSLNKPEFLNGWLNRLYS